MESLVIPPHEIAFHPTSFCDRDGRVFRWQGELYRGITRDKANFYRQMFADGIICQLVEKGFLVETELTDLKLEGYAMVLKHRLIPFVSYANEWCSEMLKDAALFITDMMLALAERDLTLGDVSTWDMLFDYCRPVFVDFCSISDADRDGNRTWSFFKDNFYSYFIYPLRLMARGHGNLARHLLADYEHNTIHPEFAALMGYPSLYNPPNHPLKRGKIFGKKVLVKLGLIRELEGYELVKHLRREVLRIQLPKGSTDREIDLEPNPLLPPSGAWTPKQRIVRRVLTDLHPSTVLDIGCHRGWYALLAASLGSRVVAVDRNDRHVAQCYGAARDKALPILPLVVDIRYPSPGQGVCNQVLTPALQRLPCEMVLALGIVDVLVFEQHLNFEQICETLAAFSKSWLLVEFCSPADSIAPQQKLNCPSWYTLQSFADCLRKQFRHVNEVHSHLQSDRTSDRILLCRK
ncbi:class I SAM-dependent methyltransferase [Altericista sp. CCNU0014]|uniref:class I SAM-dependent methyltransferase n=1 Tax=Altericista sp. CCNU0014 TaxID=3082949 RepID=UPI00384B7469